MSAGLNGESYCEGCLPPQQSLDLAMCLVGTEGGVFGACCDDQLGSCQSGVEITSCEDSSLRFVPDTDCNDLDPACGVILGACCFDDLVCSIEQEQDCGVLGGTWLGANTICSACPCTVACPPGAIAEGEPVCFPGYDDQFNGGCDGSVEAFSPIAVGDTVCGTSGVWTVGIDEVGDFDWYELSVLKPFTLEWSALAEFPAVVAILDGSFGCFDPPQLAVDAQFECDPLSVSVDVDRGTYWLVIGPIAFTDESNCGTGYRVNASIACPADLDGNGVVDTVDFLALLAAWGTPDGDVDGDGTTDTIDFLALLAAWGPCP